MVNTILQLSIYWFPQYLIVRCIESINKCLTNLKYDNKIILGDHNVDMHNKFMEQFCNENGIETLIFRPTCFKSPENPSTIDHILVNCKEQFLKTSVLETGLSDFHKLTLTVLNKSPPKRKARLFQYRNFSKLNADAFKNDLKHKINILNKQNKVDFESFNKAIKSIVDQHLPLQKRYARNNEAPFMNRRLRKEIMLRSKKKNTFNNNPTTENWNQYRLQRNKCVKVLREVKGDFYASLDLNNIFDSKRFWRTIKPIFSEKVRGADMSALIENNDIISDKSKISNIMNEYYVNVTDSLNIGNIPCDSADDAPDNLDAVDQIISKFRSHPSINAIKRNIAVTEKFCFKHVNEESMEKHIDNLDTKKASPQGDIPTKIIKDFSGTFNEYLTNCYNHCCFTSTFPNSLKLADVSPLFKKGTKTNKENYRPISKLPNISKVFERIMHDNISSFMSDKLSSQLSGFRSGYSTQQALLVMIDKWQRSLDKSDSVAAILMDLSKAFDCVNHELLIAKLNAYGFSKSALNFVHSYLTERAQRVQVESEFSSYQCLKIGVPQGSILGPLLFNIYLNDLFFDFIDPSVHICNYADDNTLYEMGNDVSELIRNLKMNMLTVNDWFQNNGLQLNVNKCELIVLEKNPIQTDIFLNKRYSVKRS